MTRFMITLTEAVQLVWHAFSDMLGGEIYVKKIPSMNIIDIAKAVAPDASLRTIGIRPGEKIHEQMIGLEDAAFTYEYQTYYKILPQLNNIYQDSRYIKSGSLVPSDFTYTSNGNTQWMTVEQLRHWINSQEPCVS